MHASVQEALNQLMRHGSLQTYSLYTTFRHVVSASYTPQQMDRFPHFSARNTRFPRE